MAITAVLCAFFSTNALAQTMPTWNPPPAASISDVSLSTITADSPHNVEVINCDMYMDVSTATYSGEYIMAIVWDEQDNTGVWHVYAEVRNSIFGSTPMSYYHIASEARHPDVALGDPNAGNVAVGIVYENTQTQEVNYVEYELTGISTGSLTMVGGAPTVGSTTFNNNTSNLAINPHIDALPRYTTTPTWFAGAGANTSYQPLRDYAVTWTEWDGSSNYEVWIDKGTFNAAPSGSPTKVDIGTNSDIATVLQDNTNELAYVSYIDNSGDIYMEEFDISGAPSSNGVNPIQSGQTIVGTPRIDACNVVNTGNLPYTQWAVTYQINNSSNNEVRVYDNIHGLMDLATVSPYTTNSSQGYNPVIAVGPGYNDYNGNGVSEVGNVNYLHASIIDSNTSIYATDYGVTSNNYGPYQTVNNTLLHASVGVTAPIAISTSSNSGIGHLAAWLNFHTGPVQLSIDSKVNTGGGTSMSFKPGKPNSIVKNSNNSTNYRAYPNPAAEYVIVENVAKETIYCVTDITGRKVLQGIIDRHNTKIVISELLSGIYVFTFNNGTEVRNFKLVKQ